MAKTVLIELEFFHDNVTETEILIYLQMLMESGDLDWEFVDEDDEEEDEDVEDMG